MKHLYPAALAVIALLSYPAISQTAAPASQPPVASAETPEIHDLQKVEDSWSTALNKRDQYGLELVLSPLFVNVSASGDFTTRNQQVAGLITSEDKTATIDQRVVTVRMLGDIAVANGIYDYTHKSGNSEVEEKGVFTHVFQKQHGNWVCLNAQRTPIRETAPGKSGKVKGKTQSQSKAELPFHIPLFSKSDKADTETTAPSQPNQ